MKPLDLNQVYMSDVNVVELQHTVKLAGNCARSEWFTRGWNLQELLAPKRVEFSLSEGTRLDNKTLLEERIHRTTGIAVEALQGRSLSDFSVSERMRWTMKRTTTRKEDEAYSLLGIFDIHMPLIYGEREKTLARLREQIERSPQGMNTTSLFRLPCAVLGDHNGQLAVLNSSFRSSSSPLSRC